MVSTRSSARKPPHPSRPSSAPARLNSQPDPTPVPDDLPPPNPRRSRRIRQKNAGTNSSLTVPVIDLIQDDNLSQPSVVEEDIAETQNGDQQHPLVQENTMRKEPVVATPNENQTSQHSDDEPPEEIKTVTIEPRIDPSHHAASQHTIKKNRRRRQRDRQRRKQEKSTSPLPSPPSQPESQLQNVTPIEESPLPVCERLSTEAIAAAQSALEDAKNSRQNAKQIARLEDQVKHIGRLNRPQQVGQTKVALASDTFSTIRRPTKKGRKSAASFLASCIQKGPKRVPASKIAIMARSTRY